jgi:hypothetical protein
MLAGVVVALLVVMGVLVGLVVVVGVDQLMVIR